MLQNTRALLVIAATLAAGAAFANHPDLPINLSQSYNGASLPVGGIVPTAANGTGTVVIGANHGTAAGSCCGPYVLEIEIQPVNVAFTGTQNYSSAQFTSGTPPNPFPPTSISLTPGTYHWQVREYSPTYGIGNRSAWVLFNGGNAAFTIRPPGVPDISVPTVNMTNTVLDIPNDTLSFNVVGDFLNRGDTTSGGFLWKAYLSTDQVLQPGTDTLVYTSTVPIDVPAESTLQDTSATITLSPRPPPGEYYVLIEADPAPAGCTSNCGSVSEFDETNNIGSTANYFTNGLDIVATSISNGPALASPGQSVTLNVSFFNQGIESPSGNSVEFRIVASHDDVVSSDDFEVYRASVPMTGGQSYSAAVTFTLPPGITGGDAKWGLEVDPAQPGVPNPNVEANETNNTLLSSTKTHIQQADLEAAFADLVDVLTLQPTRKADIGFPARMVVDATNIGDFASPPHHACVLLSEDNTPSLLKDEIIDEETVPGIPSGANNTARYDLQFTVPTTLNGAPLKTGDYFLFAFLDCNRDINELNEGNNTKVVMGPVRLRTPLADYATLKVYAPTKAAGGEVIPLQRIFANLGTDAGPATEYRCYASVNNIVTSQDFLLRFVKEDGTLADSRPLQLEMGKTDAATDQVLLPGNMPSRGYYLGCVVDPDGKVTELEEDNNAAYTATQVQVTAQAFQVVTQQLPDATLETPYSFILSTRDAPGAVTWSAEGLPEGISLDQQTGTLHGAATLPGLTQMKVQAHSGTFIADAVLVMRVLPPTTELTITTPNLPAVTNSTSTLYQAALSASGGVQPYTWSVVDGALPAGINLNASTGALSGQPRPGQPLTQVTLTVQVKDSFGNAARKEMKLRMVAPGSLAISTLSIPDTLVGADYFADLAAEVANGGTLSKPLQWTVVQGHLPDGLVLSTHTDQATGLITGKAAVAGMFPVTVQVQDADGRADSIDFVVHSYAAGLQVTLAAPPAAAFHPGDAVALQVTSTGGTGSAKYTLFSGALPAGVSLTEDGKVSGTVSDDAALGTYNFVVKAVDVSGGEGLGAFSLEVVAQPKPQGCSSTGTAPFAGALLAGLGLLGFASRKRQAR